MKVNKQKLELAMARSCSTTVELAEKAQIPRPTVSAIVSGRNSKPATIGKLAKALGVDVTEIIEQ